MLVNLALNVAALLFLAAVAGFMLLVALFAATLFWSWTKDNWKRGGLDRVSVIVLVPLVLCAIFYVLERLWPHIEVRLAVYGF
jgi:uncharacterized membrane protein YphA (DoxX/SURF4 family)